MNLAEKKCQPCDGGTPKLDKKQIDSLAQQLNGWTAENNKLSKTIKTKDFKSSLELANRIGDLAEEQGHHPDLLVRWGELKIELWTHAVDGLTESDFVLAAKIDQVQ